MRRFALLLLLTVPSAVFGQEDPLQTHLYNVEFLTESVPDFQPDPVGVAADMIGTHVVREDGHRLLDVEELALLIKTNIAEDTWGHVASQITFTGAGLTVTNRKSVHEKIARYLDYWRGRVGKLITVDAVIVSIDPLLLARLRAAGNGERPSILPPEQYRLLLEAAREGKQGELLKAFRLSAHSGQRVCLQDLVKQAFIPDYDAQIATGAGALDPVMDILATGPSIDLRPFLEPFAGGITLEVRLDTVEPDG